TDELIKTVKESSKICHYFDIPIQHISDSVLKRMNRKSNGESIRKLIIKLRKEIPDVIIRTTVMVGFPGETQEDFEELYEFLKEAKFDKLGAFTYSKEEGTAAEKMPNQVHPSTKRNRYNKVMKLQQEISKKNLENKIETIQKVRIEGMTNNKKYYVGRSYMDVPEIDGLIYIENTKALNLGEWINCKIIGIKEYDMIGKIN
ncbi:MAG: radical SAM protein, partial [Clostridiales bacterium]